MNSRKKKVIIGGLAVVVLAAIIGFSLNARRKDLIPVETGKVELRRQLIAKVSATGEIKPKEYVELQAEIAGVITDLPVKEGDFVRQGEILLRIDPIQTESETRAQEAILSATLSEAQNQSSQIAVQRANLERDRTSVHVAETEVDRADSSLRLAESNFERKQQLFEDNLIPRETYDAAKNDLVTADAALKTAKARLEQAQAQLAISSLVVEQAETSYESAQSRVQQQRALLRRTQDLLDKTIIRSPLTGVITQMNVEVGERAVPGTLNNPAATLMIIANLAVIEAEVEVDEADIVDVAVGQKAEVKVDALPDTPLLGTVTEVGNSAIPTTSQQEAKEFKVVVQLEAPPPSLRPGLSCTAEITTSTRENVLAVPIQALTVREFPVDANGAIILEEPEKGEKSPATAEAFDKKELEEKKEFEGVFLVQEGKATFQEIKTGIMGDNMVEVLSGLNEGTVIATGSYKTLRTLKHGDLVKETKPEKEERG